VAGRIGVGEGVVDPVGVRVGRQWIGRLTAIGIGRKEASGRRVVGAGAQVDQPERVCPLARVADALGRGGVRAQTPCLVAVQFRAQVLEQGGWINSHAACATAYQEHCRSAAIAHEPRQPTAHPLLKRDTRRLGV